MMILTVKDIVACVASVSVGFSAGLKHFSLFGRAKTDLGGQAQFPLSYLLTPNFHFLHLPQFLRGQKA